MNAHRTPPAWTRMTSVNPHMSTWGPGPPRGPVPQHCCIVSSYDCGGDGCGGMGCPYLAFCGPTRGDGQTDSSDGGNAYNYACWGGCNLADATWPTPWPVCHLAGQSLRCRAPS